MASSTSTITVFVVTADVRSERRIDLHTTVGQLKEKLETVTGIPVQNQVISLYRNEEDPQPIRTLDDDSRPLGYYSITSLQTLKVEDANPSISFTGQLTDLSQVQKFELTDAEYSQRNDTVLEYKKAHQVGRFAPKTAAPEHSAADDSAAVVAARKITVAARCSVTSAEDGSGVNDRGTVRYVGPTEFGNKTGVWVGVEYDLPYGKNDGSVQGKRYFMCPPSRGAFVRPTRVTVGDFPPENLEMDDDEEI